MTVWATASVEDEPEITLVRWHVFETPGGGRHFCGYNRSGREGRVSSRIVTFDPHRMTGRTSSGRVYALSDPAGMDTDAIYVRSRWLDLSGIPGDPVVVTDLAALSEPVPVPPKVPLQEWQGYVLEVGPTTFTCRLVDLTAGETIETEEAEIPLVNVPAAERGLVRPGAYLRWSIHGTPEGAASTIDFASTPAFTAEDLAAAEARAAELHAHFHPGEEA